MEDVKIFYPLNLEPRKQQLEMIKFVSESINRGKKFILLNAPTGSGKSYFVNMFINWYLNNVYEKGTFDILTNSKVLQEQYINEFSFINNLKGRNNYYCDVFDTDCEKGMELCTALKKMCDNCPYVVDRQKWEKGQVGLTNFHMFNTFCMYNNAPLDRKDGDARVLIIDEAHDYEAVFSDFITLKLSAKLFKKYGFTSEEIEQLDNRIVKLKTIQNCVDFFKFYFVEKIQSMFDNFEDEVKRGVDIKRSTELTKYITYISGQLEKIKTFVDDYDSTPTDKEPNPKENWVLDINKIDKNTTTSGIELNIQPVWVHKYLDKFVWSRFDHILFLSGTILDMDMFSYINGLNPKLTTFLSLDSTFDIKNRPIYYIKCGKMTYNEKVDTFNIQKDYIKRILDKNKGNKGIIHATTYEFSEWIKNSIKNSRLLFHESNDREDKLQEHIKSEQDSVIVSPSMHTGIDLKDDLSRFQIILKIPYPNISSNKIKQRQKTRPEWYNWKTAVDLIQAIGRSVRSETDKAETYILDSSLSTLLAYSGDLIPRYISDAIKEIKMK